MLSAPVPCAPAYFLTLTLTSDSQAYCGHFSQPIWKSWRSAAEVRQIIYAATSMKNALSEQLGQHKQIGPENSDSQKHRDLILKEDNISRLVPLNQHNYAEGFADSPPASLHPSPRYCSTGNNLISVGGGERAVTALLFQEAARLQRSLCGQAEGSRELSSR